MSMIYHNIQDVDGFSQELTIENFQGCIEFAYTCRSTVGGIAHHDKRDHNYPQRLGTDRDGQYVAIKTREMTYYYPLKYGSRIEFPDWIGEDVMVKTEGYGREIVLIESQRDDYTVLSRGL